MAEVVDDDGAPRPPNHPLGNEKDDNNDPAGPALDSPGLSEDVILPGAHPEKSQPHKAVEPAGPALDSPGLSEDVILPGAHPEKSQPHKAVEPAGPALDSPGLSEDVILPGAHPEKSQPHKAVEPAGPALDSAGLSEDVILPGAHPEKSQPHKVVSISNGDSGSADLNPSAVAGVAGSNPGGISSVGDSNAGNVGLGEIKELDDAPTVVKNPGDVARAVVENPGVNTDGSLWCKAIEEEDCEELGKLLAKDISYFWKYEKKDSKTALHAAANKGDLMLAELVLDQLSWAKETDDPDLFFRDRGLCIDEYIAAETSGKTAEEVAQDNYHAGITYKILDYIANDTQRRTYKDKRMDHMAGISSKYQLVGEYVECDEATKKKDCQALLKRLKNEDSWHWTDDCSMYGHDLLRDDVRKTKFGLKYGKSERRTMLHVAAMQGCFPLAKLILDMLRSGGGGLGAFRELYIQAVDDLSGLTAFEMVNDITGNRSISEYLKENLQVKTENDDYRIPLISESHGELISFEAYPGTRWYMALKRGDTRELKRLLELNSRFVLETCHGMTVLHVAILWDDLELVKAVVKLFEDSKEDTKEINWGDSYYPSSLKLKDMIEVARSIDHRDMDLYWAPDPFRGGNPRRAHPHILKQLKRGGKSCLLLAELLERREIVEELQKLPLTSTTVTLTAIIDNEEYSTMPLRLGNFFKETWEKSPQWNDQEFRKDEDFNFEDSKRQGWLKFHYACKDPMKFKDLLQEVASYINQHPYDGTKLFQTLDAKGRTPIHILMDHYSDQQDPGWPFDEIFIHKCYKDWIQIAENARGTRIIDMVLTKNYLQRNIILQPLKYFKLDLQHEKFEHSEITAFLYYQVACFLKQINTAEEIWSSLIEKKDLKTILKKHQDEFKSMLLNAASTGNQTCLQLLLDTNHDPMITDTQGRSLLHHAADPTLLFPQLVGKNSFNFTTVEDLCDMKKKWSEGNTSYSPQVIPSSGSTTSISSGSSTPNSSTSVTSNSKTQDVIVAERSNVGRKACILMLLQAGVDLGQSDKDDKVPSIGPTIDATYQSWWYDTVVKDSTDKRNGYSQAGNALSVVGTLVAATSYIGPLQPPLSYDTSDSGSTGFVKTTEPLIKAFMVSTSVAFYFAMASVMFAVVSSLPMPQEGVMGELKRAKHVVSLSLCLLLIAIVSIIVSFATASIVAIQNEHSFHSTDLLFVPSIIGWFFCFLGIGGFFIRVARLIFYKDPIIRKFYQFSYGRGTLKCLVFIVFCLDLLVSISLYVPILIVYKIIDVADVHLSLDLDCLGWSWDMKHFFDDRVYRLKSDLRLIMCSR